MQITINRTDEEVVKLYLETRDTSNFTELYNRYAGKIFSKCLIILKDNKLANEATQDIFLKLYLNITNFKFHTTFSAWAYSTAYSSCIKFMRRNKDGHSSFSEQMDISNAACRDEDFNIELIEVNQLKIILDHISPIHRAILLMKYQDDMSIEDISNVLDESERDTKIKIKTSEQSARACYINIYEK